MEVEKFKWLEKHSFVFGTFVYNKIGKCYTRTKCIRFYTILHVAAGKAKVTIENHINLNASGGMVVSIPPNTFYTVKASADLEMYSLNFSITLLNGDSIETYARLPYLSKPKCFEENIKTLSKMHKKYRINDVAPFLIMITPIIHEIVLRLITTVTLVKGDLLKDVNPNIRMICQRLKSSGYIKFNARELAREACMSVSCMNYSFKKYFNTSPQRYWEQIRFAYICLELETSGKTFSEMAMDFGFASLGHFSNWFKRKTRMTPSEFRKKSLENNLNPVLG